MGARGGKPCLGVACADRRRPFIAGLTTRRRYHDPIGETQSLLYPLEANFGRTLILSTYRLAFHLSFGFAPRNVIICFSLVGHTYIAQMDVPRKVVSSAHCTYLYLAPSVVLYAQITCVLARGHRSQFHLHAAQLVAILLCMDIDRRDTIPNRTITSVR